jgi:hypothetical protein
VRRSKRRIGLTLALCCCLASVVAPGAPPGQSLTPAEQRALLAQPEKIPRLLAEGALAVDQVPDPHWREDGCRACHVGRPGIGAARLRDNDINRLCNVCHERISDHSYIHPVAMIPPDDMLERMPKAFRLALREGDRAVTCTTCHELTMQCLPERASRRPLNPGFLRGAPYRNRFGLCFRCHDQNNYRRLGAHDQVTDAGKVRKARCSVCHRDTAKLATAWSIADLSFTVKGDLSSLCTRCHEPVPHPSGGLTFLRHGTPDHLVVPSPEMLERMQRMQARHGVILPLEPGSGRIFCGTCHNPHERGVIKRAEAARGADSRDRLRAPRICLFCHAM